MTFPPAKPVAPHLVSYHATVAQALKVMEQASPKIAVVTDAAGKLLRTVSDGDIRRGLLHGLTVESRVTDLPSRAPVHSHMSAPIVELRQTMRKEKVEFVVLVDKNGSPTGIVDHMSIGEGVMLSPPHMGTAEIAYIQEAFHDNYIAPAGPNLIRFESKLVEQSGKAHALAVSSGTAAIHLALRVLNVVRGDRVYVSNLTFIASLQPILYEGCEPVLIDSEPVSWNISPDALKRQLARDAAAGQLPRAIIVVHLYGQPADMDTILELANYHGVPVVEDAAESLGATYRQRPSGSHGLLSAYSFNGNKIITTSGGGALVSDNESLIARARKLSTQGRDNFEHYQHSLIAYNYRMSNILAGIGCGQLDLLADRVKARRAIHRHYRERLSHVPGIGFQEEIDGGTGNRWLTVITLDPDKIPVHCYQVIRGLREVGIEARPGWKPMTMQPLCRAAQFVPHSSEKDISSRLFLQSVCLPSGSALDEATQDRVCDRILALIED